MLAGLARRDAALGEPKLLYLATVMAGRGLIALAWGASRVHLPPTSFAAGRGFGSPGPYQADSTGSVMAPAARNADSSTAPLMRPAASPSRPSWSACSASTSPAMGTATGGRLFRIARGGPLNDTGYGEVWQRARPTSVGPLQGVQMGPNQGVLTNHGRAQGCGGRHRGSEGR